MALNVPLATGVSIPLGITQLGLGIQGFVRAQETADALQDAKRRTIRDRSQAGQQRAGSVRVAFAASGVEVDSGSPLAAIAANEVATARAVQNIAFNFEMRRERVLSEGIADLTAGIGASTQTFLGGLRSFLDAPQDNSLPVLDSIQDIAPRGSFVPRDEPIDIRGIA